VSHAALAPDLGSYFPRFATWKVVYFAFLGINFPSQQMTSILGIKYQHTRKIQLIEIRKRTKFNPPKQLTVNMEGTSSKPIVMRPKATHACEVCRVARKRVGSFWFLASLAS
jgi:hypothetical protein